MLSLPLLLAAVLLVAALGMAQLAWQFATDPDAALVRTTHRLEQLPLVMADRYFAFVLVMLGLIFFGTPAMTAVVFAALAVMGFADAAIYSRAGHATKKHLIAGAMSSAVALLALYFAVTGGA